MSDEMDEIARRDQEAADRALGDRWRCPQCGEKVSNKTDECPECGARKGTA